MTLPNLLTIFRIVLIPVFVVLLLKDSRVWALIVFLCTCLSDGLDGYIARTWQQQTTLGAFLDPIADKLLMMTAFITLAVLQAIDFRLTIVLVGRDIALSLVIGMVLFTTGRRLAKPSDLGRAALFCQMATVVCGLLFYVFDDQPIFQVLRPFLLWPLFIVTGVLAVAAGVHYIYQLIRLLQKVEERFGDQMPVQ
jgi:cardiolipin synthase